MPPGEKKIKMRGPGIEPGSTAWKATMLTITPATLTYGPAIPSGPKNPLTSTNPFWFKKSQCNLRGSNSRGLCPLGLKSSALTTRPRLHEYIKVDKKKTKQKNSQSETRTHNLPVNSRARCRLRHPGIHTRSRSIFGLHN